MTNSRSSYFSTRNVLVAFVVVLIALVGGIIGKLSLTNGRQSVQELAVRLAYEIGDRVNEQIEVFVETAPKVNQLNQNAIEASGITLAQTSALELLFWKNIHSFPVSLTYIGTEEGEYYGSRWLENNVIVSSLANAKTGYLNQRYATNEYGKRTKLINTSTKVYDPRKRPWYIAAKNVGKAIWSEIYPDFSSGVLGITAAKPLYGKSGKLLAVLATDLLFDRLNAFMHKLKVSRNGRAFILERSGNLISTSTAETLFRKEGGKTVRLHGKNSTDPSTRLIVKHLISKFGSLNSIKERMNVGVPLDGELYFVEVVPLQDSYGLDWLVAVVIPEADFLDRINANTRWTIFFILLAINLAIVFGVAMTHWITRPLLRVSDDMHKVANFELGEDLKSNSILHEIKEIEGALTSMKRGLRSFEKYVSADLVRQLIRTKREASLGVERADVTIFFSDIVGFTTVCEEVSAIKLIEILGEYLDEMTRVILASGGTVDKYIGDAIMAFWNAPEPVENHEIIACSAALACVERLEELQVSWRARGLPALECRIGLAAGDVLVGNVGSNQRMDYTVIGDNVNLASRIEGVNKHYGTKILINELLYKSARDVFVCRPVDIVTVKGKSEVSSLFEILGRRESASKEILELSSHYTEAFTLYQARSFKEAIVILEKILTQTPTDIPSTRLLARSENFIKNPPPSDWNGAFAFDEK